jgi:hypothetical protein
MTQAKFLVEHCISGDHGRRALLPRWKPAFIAIREVATEGVSLAETSALARAANREPPAFPEQTPSGISPPAACPMSLEDRAGNAINDRFRDGTHDFSRKRPEMLSSFCAERNRSVTIVEDPRSIPGRDENASSLHRRFSLGAKRVKGIEPSLRYLTLSRPENPDKYYIRRLS